ncbi:Prephenate dehydratase-domain-containing protein [Zopfochytrium polystomum]|nr:Prephenate dehydratase-domain-containing protein [Zopfochytrium polystomum]
MGITGAEADALKRLAELRSRIDVIDAQLVALLNERAQVSINIGLAKKAAAKASGAAEDMDGSEGEDKTHVHIPAREMAVYQKVKSLNRGPLTGESLEAIFREIMSASISLQRDVVIAYLGPKGSFSQNAAYQRFGESVLYAEQKMIKDIFTAVESGAATYGVVPFENSTHGSVAQALDAFLVSTKVMVRAETYLPIHHCLLSNSPVGGISKVYSHPEAFGQVSGWLNANLKEARRETVSSTSYAAELASKEPGTAAVCNAVCAEIYGLKIVASNIEDKKNNTTRFLIIGDKSEGPSAETKTLLYFTVDHRQPGALADALTALKTHNINLSKIDSRPRGDMLWHYYFIVELSGHMDDENVRQALEDMRPYCLMVKVLGSYPAQSSATSPPAPVY